MRIDDGLWSVEPVAWKHLDLAFVCHPLTLRRCGVCDLMAHRAPLRGEAVGVQCEFVTPEG